MHWSEEIARRIVERNPDKAEYVCAAGISPSGSIHIGNFRDVATSYFVVRALRRMGKRARLLFSWDEFDRLRKVPVNVAKINSDMEKYIGYPYVDVENPFPDRDQYPTYAAHFQAEFERSIKQFGIEMDYRYQSQMYRSGKYVDLILHALKKRREIFDIIDRHRTQDAAEGERDSYYPVSIYCPVCHRDTTRITSLAEDCTVATYTCACGHSGTFDFTRDFNCKLAWKVDWPMRWKYEGVDFEPGGKDHASINGSYDTSKDIAREIFGYEAPIFQGYEFIGLKGTTGKMSGSSGLNLTPGTLLQLYQPEVILWLYAKTEPLKAFDFCFDDGILRQYFEFDKMYTAYRDGTAPEHIARIVELSLVPGRTVEPVPMSLLVQLGSVVDFNVPMLETVFSKIGTPYRYEQFRDRLDRARFWLEQCAPDQVNRLRATRNFAAYETFTPTEQEEIRLLYQTLQDRGMTLDELNTRLYAIPAQACGREMDDKERKTAQGAFFRRVYRLLLDRETGPRLYLFLYAIDRDRYLPLLDFSHPRTAEEERLDAEAAAAAAQTAAAAAPAKPERVYGDPDPVAPVKDEITMEDFARVDLRVCRIVKAAEIRKSANCLRLTLWDGARERTIVSSIRHDYSCEELVGKKIIVVANLKPARFSGVTSEGMLLAGTNNACGCVVIFVDDRIPEGTAIR